MKTQISTASIRVDGKRPGAQIAGSSANTEALGTADRLANVGQLAAGLAHEMNTPLGAISGHAEEALEVLDYLHDDRLRTEKLADLRGRLLAIMRQAHRCSRIATRLLQFAQSARPMPEKGRTERVIDDVLQMFGPAAQEKEVRLDHVVESELPEAPIGAADLEQLLVNLVQNSLDASGPSDIVRIKAYARDGQLHLVISDTGSGIGRETLSRIFDPFFTTKPVGQGTGLGLSVCHGIVRSVGGSIEVQSAPGHGTRVTVMLPVDSNAPVGIQLREACPVEMLHREPPGNQAGDDR